MANPHIVIADSGIGGLSVLRALHEVRPDFNTTYVADHKHFPYGDWEAQNLIAHLIAFYGDLITTHKPDALVVACNTASTLILEPLRARHSLPIIGTVPAIKPAAAFSKTGHITVLATPGTVKRDYTQGLINNFAGHRTVELVGSATLAALVEDWLIKGATNELRDQIAEEVAPCFVKTDDDARTDCIALACTHYPLIMPLLKELAPWPVHWFDPAPAIARRIVSLLATSDTGLAVEPKLFSTDEKRQSFVEIIWSKRQGSA